MGIEKGRVPFRAALLIVDVQRWIFERQDPVYNEEVLIRNINALEAYAHRKNIPVVYIQHESSGNMKKHSQGWRLHEKLNSEASDVYIGKRKGNAFSGTSLHALLREKDVRQVLICGLLSQQCILKTGLGALELGFDTVLIADAHGNSGMYPEKNINMTNKAFERAGAILMSTMDVVSS